MRYSLVYKRTERMRRSGKGILRVVFVLFTLILSFNLVSAADYRNAYMVVWGGSNACDNLAYAKSMGYDYVGYQAGMENCMSKIDMYFYIESPDQDLQIKNNYIYPSGSYTAQEKATYNDLLLWKSSASFPNNLATGWFRDDGSFMPLADFQQQKVIDYVVSESLSSVKNIEDKSKNFLFGGWAWDVPSLKGDLWSSVQSGGGKQVDVSYWTGSCSGIQHPGLTQDYSCYADGKAAFYKKLFSETRKQYPNMKIYMEPFNPWTRYMSEIASRSDVAQLKPDLLCEEGPGLEFVTDSRLFASGLMTKDKVCSSTPNVFDHKGNLVIAGNAGINGAWFLWFGRLGGTGNFPSYSSIKLIPDRLKLIRAMPGWDNLNSVPLSSRKWDATKLEYKSTLSFANMNIIYSVHPKNKKTYVVVLNKSAGLNLQGKTVDTIYSVDELFSPKAEASGDFTQTNGILYLNADANLGKGYVITFNDGSSPPPNSTNSTNTTVVASCGDSDGGNMTFVKGVVSGVSSSGKSFSYNDYCFMNGSVSKVREYYCSGVNSKLGDYVCANGCSDSACLATAPTPPPSDPAPPADTHSGGSSGGGGGSGSSDTVAEPYCGDDTCDAYEDCSSCASDCGECPVTITMYCGDGVCTSSDEDCSTCSIDCGTCASKDSSSDIYTTSDLEQNTNVDAPQEIIGAPSAANNRNATESEITGRVIDDNVATHKSPMLAYSIILLVIIATTVAFVFFQRNKLNGEGVLSNVRNFSHFETLYPTHAKDLISYIKKAKKLGHSEYLIKYNLSNGGWPEHIISFAMTEQENA
jgi:hypothetical protein